MIALAKRALTKTNADVEIQAPEADRGRYLGYVRIVGRRQGSVKLSEQIESVPTEYAKKPLLHSRP